MDLSNVAAPMVNQSDLPFRVLVRRHGASLAYTQMLLPERLLNDQDYLEHHQRDLTASVDGLERPVVVQLCGHDPETIVSAGRKLQSFCDGIDLNLGCPQDVARKEHYGAYLLGQKDWPVVENIVSAMSRSFIVPTSVKLRLCQPASKTVDLGKRLEACGASWIALHARNVSARRRRQGAADLTQVRNLKMNLRIPVVSNGNVRVWNDLEANRTFTGADGLMVGETLLGNPCLFANKTPDPFNIGLEYLDICRLHLGTASLKTVQTHIRHFVEFQCVRRPWFQNFHCALDSCETLDDIDALLRSNVSMWSDKPICAESNEPCTSPDDDGFSRLFEFG